MNVFYFWLWKWCSIMTNCVTLWSLLLMNIVLFCLLVICISISSTAILLGSIGLLAVKHWQTGLIIYLILWFVDFMWYSSLLISASPLMSGRWEVPDRPLCTANRWGYWWRQKTRTGMPDLRLEIVNQAAVLLQLSRVSWSHICFCFYRWTS